MEYMGAQMEARGAQMEARGAQMEGRKTAKGYILQGCAGDKKSV